MTMPPIADVKAAAERVNAHCEECVEYKVPLTEYEHQEWLCARFALAVLNAPGMSAERLAEILSLADKSAPGPWGNDGFLRDARGEVLVYEFCYHPDPDGEDCEDPTLEFITQARTFVPELLAEVLRLRAGKETA